MKYLIEIILCGMVVLVALIAVKQLVVPAQQGNVAAGVLYAQIPTPVLNTPDMRSVFGGKDGNTLKVDNQGLIRAVETTLLPGQPLRVLAELNVNGIKMYRISTPAYPYAVASGLYVDARFVGPKRPDCNLSLPAPDKIMANMLSMIGSEYVWGGNWHDGIMQMLQFYPPKDSLDGSKSAKWMLTGVDCSGLLYEATNGNTPRNTSSLITFGQPVQVAGLSAKEIAAKLKPLDLIVWKGHVLIAIEKDNIIESTLTPGPGGSTGVRVSDSVERLTQIMASRVPADAFTNPKHFVVRRWYGPRNK